MEIILRRKGIDYTVKFDDEDYEKVSQHKWSLSGKTSKLYVASIGSKLIPGSRFTMHRLLMGAIGDKIMIDHRNHNTLDNRKGNLRMCTNSDNCKKKLPLLGSSSIYLGVSWNKNAKKWIANIRANEQNIYLGLFVNETDAAKAYDNYAKLHHGEFANLNFK